MPFSSDEGKDVACNWIRNLCPLLMSVLDVGPGAGAWGQLIRQRWQHAGISGVEIHGPYRDAFSLLDTYDNVVIGDARTVDWQAIADTHADGCFDLVIFGDVLEHMTYSEAVDVFTAARRVAHLVLVSLPVVPYPQDGTEENPHEAHVTEWTHHLAVETFRPLRSWRGVEIGVYLS